MALNLGDISFAVGADTSGLDKAVQKLVTFSQKVDDASRSTADGASTIAAAYKKQEAAITSALSKVLNLNNAISRGTGGNPQMLDAATTAFNKYVNTLTKGEASALAFQRANERLNLTLGGVSRSLATANASASKNAFSSLSDQFRVLGAAAVLATGPLGGIATRIAAFSVIAKESSLGQAAFIGGLVAIVDGAVKLSSAMLDAGRSVDQYTETLTAVTGSSKLGTASFNDLKAVAQASGYQIKDLADSWVAFSEASQGSALAGQAGEKVFQDLAVTLGTLHRTPEQAANAFGTLSKMLDSNTISVQNLKKGLENDLPGAYKAFQQASGMSQADFQSALKKNQISPQDIIPKGLQQYQQNLNIGPSVDNIDASQNKLHNSMQTFMNDLDKSIGITEGAKSSYNALAAGLDYLDSIFTTNSAGLQSFTSGFIAFVATAATITTVVAGLRALATAVGLVDVAMALNPFGAVALAIAALIAVLVGGTAAWNAYHNASGAAVDGMSDAASKAYDLAKAMKQANDPTFAGSDALKNLQADIDATSKKLDDMRDKAYAPVTHNPTWIARQFGEQSETTIPGLSGSTLTSYKNLELQLARDNDAMKQLSATVNKPVGRTPSFGMSSDQLTKIDQTKDKLTEMYSEITKGNDALSNGGLEGYNKLKETFADNKEILQYAKDLNTIPANMRDGLPTVNQFAAALKQFRTLSDDAKFDNTVMNDFANDASKGFGDIEKAIADMVTSSKLNLASLRSSLQAAAADIVQTALTLSVLNPLKNALFGLGGTSGQLATIGGGKTSNPIGGLGFLSSLIPGSGASGGVINGGALEGPTLSGATLDTTAAASSGSWLDSLAAFLPFANGGAFKGGVRFLANGGILNGPTMFGTSSGMAVGGEAGTEAVMPLVRGSNGKLGVANHGGGGGGVTVNISTPNYQSFAHPQSQAQVASQISKAVYQSRRNA